MTTRTAQRATDTTSFTGWPRWVETWIIVSFWIVLAAAALVRRALLPEPRFSLHTVAVTAVEYLPWLLLTPGIFALARRFPIERPAWLGRVVLHVAMAVTASLAVGEIQRRVITALGPPLGMHERPPQITMRAAPPEMSRPASPDHPGDEPGMRRGGPPLFEFSYQIMAYCIILGIGFARAYALQLGARNAETARLADEAAELTAERERLASQLSEARLHALRMQLNPHFLFNALNAVSALAEDDPAGVRRIVARLSMLLRRVLEGAPAQEITLTEELTFLHDYLDIQSIRFNGRLEIREEIEPGTLDARVPAFILQPLVENAVEHGAGRVQGTGRVTITARRERGEDDAELLVITVGDNGPGPAARTAGPERSGVGLANTRERLDAHFGSAGSLALHPGSDGGFTAAITIPFRETDHQGSERHV